MLVSSLVVYNDYLSVVSSQSDIVLSALLVDNLNSHVFTVDNDLIMFDNPFCLLWQPGFYHGFASLDLFMWRRHLAFRLREICNWQVRWCGWSWMILDDPLQIDRSLFCGHKICVDLAHILYTAQSVQYVYNNIYNSVDKWLIIDVYFILSLYMYNLYIYVHIRRISTSVHGTGEAPQNGSSCLYHVPAMIHCCLVAGKAWPLLKGWNQQVKMTKTSLPSCFVCIVCHTLPVYRFFACFFCHKRISMNLCILHDINAG
jgi:hypothetical protein